MNTQLINLSNVSFSYQNRLVLDDVNWTVNEREFIAIIGPNGGGKTTLLKLILGLLPMQQGTIELMSKSPKQGRVHVGYVPQRHGVDRAFPMRVIDVVLTDVLRRGVLARVTSTDRDRAITCLEQVGMVEFAQSQLSELSGGQHQRVLIARALMTDPKLLLLDEPVSAVDARHQKAFYELLAKLQEMLSIVIVSHDISAVSVHVQKIACLNKKLIYHDSKELSQETLEATYQCPVDLIAHGVPHRVLCDHE